MLGFGAGFCGLAGGRGGMLLATYPRFSDRSPGVGLGLGMGGSGSCLTSHHPAFSAALS